MNSLDPAIIDLFENILVYIINEKKCPWSYYYKNAAYEESQKNAANKNLGQRRIYFSVVNERLQDANYFRNSINEIVEDIKYTNNAALVLKLLAEIDEKFKDGHIRFIGKMILKLL